MGTVHTGRTDKTEAVILRKRDLPGGDSSVVLFTLTHGKVRAYAKGIRTIKSRRLPHSQTGNPVNVQLEHKPSGTYLRETSLISHFTGIKKDVEKVKRMYFFLYLLDRLLPENQEEKAIYEQTKLFLVRLTGTETPPEKLLLLFGTRVMKSLGYGDDFDSIGSITASVEEIIGKKIPKHII